MYYPVNKFPDEFLISVGRGIACHVGTNGGQIISGDAGERIISEALGVPYVKKLSLEDIRNGGCGWSVKVRYVDDPATVDMVALKLTTRFPKEQTINLSPDQIGAIYLAVWSDLVAQTKVHFSDLRTIILLNEKNHRSFSLFEYETYTWNHEDFIWKWSVDEKTIHGISRNDGYWQFSIHLNDSRLFVRERIGDRQTCLLQHSGIISTDKLAEFIGFSPAHVTKLPQKISREHVVVENYIFPESPCLYQPAHIQP